MLLPVAYAVLDSADSESANHWVWPCSWVLPMPPVSVAWGHPLARRPMLCSLKSMEKLRALCPALGCGCSGRSRWYWCRYHWRGYGLPGVLANRHRLKFPVLAAGAVRRSALTAGSLTALARITLREPYGGWSSWFNLPTANYAAVALTAVVLMFVLPNGHGGRLLDWESASTIHWGVLLLFAGIAIAKAFAVTGISEPL